MNAKEKLQASDALKLAGEVDEIYSAKGKNAFCLHLKHDNPDEETLLSFLLGPTGNLRAPALRSGRTLIVGFHEETYARILR